MLDRHPGNVRRAWGTRVLLATVPTNPAAYLARFTPKSHDTLVDTGALGRPCSIHVEIRFASPSVGSPDVAGTPILPFKKLVPAVIGDSVQLRLTVRRGADMLAPTIVDEYVMPVGFLNGINDCVPFDIITCDGLGIDVALENVAPGAINPASALWVEAVATIVDMPSQLNQLTGYNSSYGPQFHIASPASIVLAPARIARRQFFIVNESTNADLYVSFASIAVVGASTLVLPANQHATYESFAGGGYTGIISGIWNNPAPNGGAVVTEGVDR